MRSLVPCQDAQCNESGWAQEAAELRQAGSSPDNRSAAAHLLSLFGRRSSGSLGRAESAILKRSGSGTQPMCLICLENLTADDFQVRHPPAALITGVCVSQSGVRMTETFSMVLMLAAQ